MVINKNPRVVKKLIVNDDQIEPVSTCNYLGTVVCENWENMPEIQTKIEARKTFQNILNVFTYRDMHILLGLRLLRCFVFSTLLYGVEAWELCEVICKVIEAFEM